MARKTTTLLAVGTLMTLSACGGDGGGGGDSGGSGETLLISMVEPTTGPFGANGQQSVLGAELAVEQVNADGGIDCLDGATFELSVHDTGAATPAQVANITQSAVQEDPVAILGAWASGFTLAASTVTEQAQIPMISESWADEITERDYKYVFKLPAHASLMGTESIDAVLELSEASGYELTTAVGIADNTSSGQVSLQAAVGRLEEGGVQVPVADTFAPGLSSGDSIALKLMAEDPDLVFLAAGLQDSVLLQNALRQQGYNGPFVGAGGGFLTADYGETAGERANGTFSSAAWNWDMPYEEAQAFLEEFEAANPDVSFPQQEAGQMYIAVHLLKQALEETCATDPTAVRDALAELTVEEGPASIMPGGVVNFDETGLNEANTPVIIQWQEGKPRTVYPEDIAEVEAIFDY